MVADPVNSGTEACEEESFSGAQLGHASGIDRVYVSRVEQAVTYVGLEIIGKLAYILDVDPAEIFRRPSRSGSGKKGD